MLNSAAGSATSPLSGIRVIEHATVLMAPLACQILGDLGADVIKVESADLDSSRVMGGGPHPEISGVAANLHRNKRSVQIDVRTPHGRDAMWRLMASADIYVTNLRPGSLERLQLDWPTVSERLPNLIYCEAHGFSADSGEADRPTFDDIIQAESGIPDLVGLLGDRPLFFPQVVADKVAGYTVLYAVLAALFDRTRTGRGTHIEVPMFDSVLAFNLVEHLSRAVQPGQPALYGRVTGIHRGPHRASDGWIAVIPYSDKNWHDLYAYLGVEHLLDAPWHADKQTRHLNASRTYGELAELLSSRTVDEWLSVCRDLGIPASRVESIKDVIADPARHRGVIEEADHPLFGAYRHVASPVRYRGERPAMRSPAPTVGQDTRRIFEELGLSSAEVDELIGGTQTESGDEISTTAARGA